MHAALGSSDIPVPRALWFEDDPSWIGTPFYVRESIPGSTSPKKLFAPDNTAGRRAIGRQVAELLARVHTADWRGLGLDRFMPVPDDPSRSALMQVERWRRSYDADRVEPRPVLAELLSWLRRNARGTPTASR